MMWHDGSALLCHVSGTDWKMMDDKEEANVGPEPMCEPAKTFWTLCNGNRTM